jgi:hypothetical protein
MTKTNRAADFLQNMNLSVAEPPLRLTKREPEPQQSTEKQVRKPAPSRVGLKHIGGYFDLETVEKVALLRARLRLDNSELIKLAVDELHRNHLAKRAFGDA